MWKGGGDGREKIIFVFNIFFFKYKDHAKENANSQFWCLFWGSETRLLINVLYIKLIMLTSDYSNVWNIHRELSKLLHFSEFFSLLIIMPGSFLVKAAAISLTEPDKLARPNYTGTLWHFDVLEAKRDRGKLYSTLC